MFLFFRYKIFFGWIIMLLHDLESFAATQCIWTSRTRTVSVFCLFVCMFFILTRDQLDKAVYTKYIWKKAITEVKWPTGTRPKIDCGNRCDLILVIRQVNRTFCKMYYVPLESVFSQKAIHIKRLVITFNKSVTSCLCKNIA